MKARWPSGLVERFNGIAVDSIHTLTEGKGIAVPPGIELIYVPGCRFPASSTLCTKPPGWVSAVMSLFSNAAGALQIDQLNQ